MSLNTNNYFKYVPYLYFTAVAAYWFTTINKDQGIIAYPILVMALPFVWQMLKPNTALNFTLGIVSVCLSSYLILGYLFEVSNITTVALISKNALFFGGIGIASHFLMALWIIRNSLKISF